MTASFPTRNTVHATSTSTMNRLTVGTVLLALFCSVSWTEAEPQSRPYIPFRTSPNDQTDKVHHSISLDQQNPSQKSHVHKRRSSTVASQCPLQFSLGISRRWHEALDEPSIQAPPTIHTVFPALGPGKQVVYTTLYEHLDLLTPTASALGQKEALVQAPQFPLLWESSAFHAAPILHDVNGDGILDAIVTDYDGGISVMGLAGKSHLFQHAQVPRLHIRRDWVTSRIQQQMGTFNESAHRDPFHSYFEYSYGNDGEAEKDVLRGVAANALSQDHDAAQALNARRGRRVSHHGDEKTQYDEPVAQDQQSPDDHNDQDKPKQSDAVLQDLTAEEHAALDQEQNAEQEHRRLQEEHNEGEDHSHFDTDIPENNDPITPTKSNKQDVIDPVQVQDTKNETGTEQQVNVNTYSSAPKEIQEQLPVDSVDKKQPQDGGSANNQSTNEIQENAHNHTTTESLHEDLPHDGQTHVDEHHSEHDKFHQQLNQAMGHLDEHRHSKAEDEKLVKENNVAEKMEDGKLNEANGEVDQGRNKLVEEEQKSQQHHAQPEKFATASTDSGVSANVPDRDTMAVNKPSDADADAEKTQPVPNVDEASDQDNVDPQDVDQYMGDMPTEDDLFNDDEAMADYPRDDDYSMDRELDGDEKLPEETADGDLNGDMMMDDPYYGSEGVSGWSIVLHCVCPFMCWKIGF